MCICIFLYKYFSSQIYSYGFHISKLNNLKVIHDLCSQCLTQTLSETTFFMGIEGVPLLDIYILMWQLHFGSTFAYS